MGTRTPHHLAPRRARSDPKTELKYDLNALIAAILQPYADAADFADDAEHARWQDPDLAEGISWTRLRCESCRGWARLEVWTKWHGSPAHTPTPDPAPGLAVAHVMGPPDEAEALRRLAQHLRIPEPVLRRESFSQQDIERIYAWANQHALAFWSAVGEVRAAVAAEQEDYDTFCRQGIFCPACRAYRGANDWTGRCLHCGQEQTVTSGMALRPPTIRQLVPTTALAHLPGR